MRTLAHNQTAPVQLVAVVLKQLRKLMAIEFVDKHHALVVGRRYTPVPALLAVAVALLGN